MRTLDDLHIEESGAEGSRKTAFDLSTLNHENAEFAQDPDRVLWTQLPGAISDEDFCGSWLALQCEMITDVKSALVLFGPPDHGPYESVAVWPNVPGSAKHLAATAEQSLRERSPLLIERRARRDSDAPSPESYEVAYPIQIAGRLYGVVIVEVTPRPIPQLEAVLQQLTWGAAWLEVLLYRRKTVENVSSNERLQAVVDVLATTVEREGFTETATAFTSDLAVRFVCERVSLGFVRGNRMHLETLSHSSRFGKKANLTRAIEAAMDEAFDQEAIIVYPPPSNTPFQINRCHQELARQHGVGAICSVPLGRAGQIYGVLTFERLADNPFDASTVELFEALAALAGPILELKLRDDRALATRATGVMQKQFMSLIGPNHVAPKLVGIGLVAAIIFFAFAKVEYKVPAKTVIEAHTQRAAVAPFNGYIAESRARAGDLVQTGQILATLDDRDLKLEGLKWRSQKEQYVKQYHLAMAQRNAAQVKIAMAQISQADAELALVEDQRARTQVRAPITGVITKGDLSQSIGAPTERGQVLFEVAPLDAYRLILQVDERDTAQIAPGQRGNIVLSAFPADPLPFRIEKVTPVSIAREGRNYFRVEAKLERTPAQLRPGMEGVGKIHVGRRLLLWSWTHRAFDWLRLLAWSWLA
jgi:Barrel-sandwich domain of CusB or HlyD membrane-fusion/GAF domain